MRRQCSLHIMPESVAAAPRVSVVMPVFNGARFIGEAIVSVLGNTFSEFELLVIDDGSTDDSVAAANHAAAGDPRVRVITVPHGGVGAARNAGLHAARGEYIANLDADDTMFPARLARQVAYLDKHPECVAIGSRVLAVDDTGTPIRIIVRTYSHEEIDSAHLAGRGGAIWNPTAMFRRDVAVAVGGYRAHLDRTGEDHDLWLRMAEVGRLANFPDVLIRYRIHGNNASISADGRERRLAVTLGNVGDAFARRGITGREPAKLPPPPLRAWERWTDRSLVLYYGGNRLRAIGPALVGLLLQPGSPVARSAARTILAGAPPR